MGVWRRAVSALADCMETVASSKLLRRRSFSCGWTCSTVSRKNDHSCNGLVGLSVLGLKVLSFLCRKWGLGGSSTSLVSDIFGCADELFHCRACCTVTLKTTSKSAKFEIIKPFLPPLHEHVKGFLSKCTVLKVDLL